MPPLPPFKPVRPKSIGRISALKRTAVRCRDALYWTEVLLDRREGWTMPTSSGFRWFFSDLAADVFVDPARAGRICVEVPLGEWIGGGLPDGWADFAQQVMLRSPGWSLGSRGDLEEHVVLRATIPLEISSPWWLHWAQWMLPMMPDEAQRIVAWLAAWPDLFAPAHVEHPFRGRREEPSGHVNAITVEATRARKAVPYVFDVADVFVSARLVDLTVRLAGGFEHYAPLARSTVQLGFDGEIVMIEQDGAMVRSTNVVHPTFGPGLRFVLLIDTLEGHRPRPADGDAWAPEQVPFYATHYDPDLSVMDYNAALPEDRSPAAWVRDDNDVVFAHLFIPAGVLKKIDRGHSAELGSMVPMVALSLIRASLASEKYHYPDNDVTRLVGPVEDWTAPIAGWDD